MMVGICRLCASIKIQKLLTKINEDSHEKSGLSQRVYLCYGIEITRDDFLPKVVCQECLNKLNEFYDYYNKVQEAQESLSLLFPKHNSEATTSKITNEKVGNIIEIVQQTVEVETTKKYKSPGAVKDVLVTPKILDQQEIAVKEIVTKTLDVQKNSFVKREIPARKETNELPTTNVLSENPIVDLGNRLESIEELNFESVNESGVSDNLLIEGLVEPDENEHNDFVEYEEQLGDDYVEPCTDTEDNGMELVEILDIRLSQKEKLRTSQHNTKDWSHYPWHCFVCDDVAESLPALMQHASEQHSMEAYELQYKCAECQKICSKYFNFLNHVRLQHRNELFLCCDSCDLHFDDEKTLAKHREEGCSKAFKEECLQIFFCSECGRGYQNKTSLKAHSKQHSDLKFFKCDLCNRFFRRANNLKLHMERLHSDDKKYSCDICGTGFGQKVNLKSHMVKHCEDKPYECNICRKSFKALCNLQKHALLHTETKGYKCDFCDNYFRTKDAKQSHERTHTKERPYKCNHCNRRFSYRSVLTAHLNTHTGARPFKCAFCVKDFTNWSNYNKHMKRIHKITATELKQRENSNDKNPSNQIKNEQPDSQFKVIFDNSNDSNPNEDEILFSIYDEADVSIG